MSLPLATRWGGAALTEGRGRGFGNWPAAGPHSSRGGARAGPGPRKTGWGGAGPSKAGQGRAGRGGGPPPGAGGPPPPGPRPPAQRFVSSLRPSDVRARPDLLLSLPPVPRSSPGPIAPCLAPFRMQDPRALSQGLRLSPQVSGKPASPRDRPGTSTQAVPFAGGREERELVPPGPRPARSGLSRRGPPSPHRRLWEVTQARLQGTQVCTGLLGWPGRALCGSLSTL